MTVMEGDLTIRQADKIDLDVALNFYNDLIDDMQKSENPPRWEKNIYPSTNDLSTAIAGQSLFLAEKDGNIAGAFVMNHTQDAAYKNVEWAFPADDRHVAVIHLLATGAKYQKQGVGKRLLAAAVTIARQRGDDVIRLDTLTWNYPGQHLYEGFGFHSPGDVIMDYRTTGPIPFRLYEYKVEKTMT